MSEGQISTMQRPTEERQRLSEPGEGRPRAVGSPLPVGSGASQAASQRTAARQMPVEEQRSPGAAQTASPPPAAARTPASPVPALPSPARAPSSGPSGMQRAMGALRATLPLVQRILPLLDGNIGAAVSNILAPPHRAPAPPPVNLTPIKESLAELETRHRALSDQLVEQNCSLKRVEDQLGMVREATDRNTLEQQELLEDLKGVAHKVNVFAFFALGLLLVSVVINVVLLHIARVIP
jgi:hypothetical protein